MSLQEIKQQERKIGQDYRHEITTLSRFLKKGTIKPETYKNLSERETEIYETMLKNLRLDVVN